MNRVCFISVYFGKIPAFFKTFFDSCAWNKDFDWLIIHDKPLLYERPSNVHEVTMGLDEFRDIVIKKININIPAIKPYKICDFRPAFGIIFEEYISGYEFWGICDTDLVLGNIGKYVTKDILDTYDKIFTMGHMSVVRNNNECNTLFMRDTKNSRNYKEVFMNIDSCIYDEYDGFTEKFCDSGFNVYKEKKCADISKTMGRWRINERWITRCIQPKNKFIEYSKEINYYHQLFWIDKGGVYRTYLDKKGNIKTVEYAYIHKIDFACDEKLMVNEGRILSADGYIKDDKCIIDIYNGNITKKQFDLYNKPHIIAEKTYDIYWFFRWKYRHFKSLVKKK